MNVRGSGILLHITSLPSAFGIGDLGPSAYRFADLLAESGQCLWQLLPLAPTSGGLGNSPYASFSAFAGNLLCISPELLAKDGWLREEDAPAPAASDPRRVDYPAVAEGRRAMLDAAYEHSRGRLARDARFVRFCQEHAWWLDDWALFAAQKRRAPAGTWADWDRPLAFRHPDALAGLRRDATDELARERFEQYLFFGQWRALRRHCNRRGLRMVGDLPLYVSCDSADVWARPDLYKLDEERRPRVVAGVPPDYFSATGQRWGNPVYDWDRHRAEGFGWWARRLGHAFGLFDAVRLDHFRGFAACWEIPAHEPTAERGSWVASPGRELLLAMSRRFAALPLIAEDLGVITADVRELKHSFDLPGMYILQFAFGTEKSKHIPYMHQQNSVTYTGVHDNNTSRGWFAAEATDAEREALARYMGKTPAEATVHQDLLRLAMQSPANAAVAPMQDVLGLDGTHRMNTPGTAQGNWQWRMLTDEMRPERLEELAAQTRFFGRA